MTLQEEKLSIFMSNTSNIANVNNADEEFLKSLTLDTSKKIIEKQEKLVSATKELSDDDINTNEIFSYIVNESKSILDESREVLTKMGDVLKMLPDPEFAKSYSSILQSMSNVVKNMTDVAASKEKSQTQVKIKEMDTDAKKELKNMDMIQSSQEGPKTVNLIMSRDEVFKKIFKSEEFLSISSNTNSDEKNKVIETKAETIDEKES